MDLIDLYWSLLRGDSSGADVHLMRGKSAPVDLFDSLKIFFHPTSTSGPRDQKVADLLASNPNAECTFKPTHQSSFNSVTQDYEGFGVRVNAHTGVVSAGSNPMAQPLFNFTVMASLVADKNDSASPRK